MSQQQDRPTDDRDDSIRTVMSALQIYSSKCKGFWATEVSCSCVQMYAQILQRYLNEQRLVIKRAEEESMSINVPPSILTCVRTRESDSDASQLRSQPTGIREEMSAVFRRTRPRQDSQEQPSRRQTASSRRTSSALYTYTLAREYSQFNGHSVSCQVLPHVPPQTTTRCKVSLKAAWDCGEFNHD